jgi:hypothetical protein
LFLFAAVATALWAPPTLAAGDSEGWQPTEGRATSYAAPAAPARTTLQWLPYDANGARLEETVVTTTEAARSDSGRTVVKFNDLRDAPTTAARTDRDVESAWPSALFTRKAVSLADAASGAAGRLAAHGWRSVASDEPPPSASPREIDSLPPLLQDQLRNMPPPEEECRAPKSRLIQQITTDIHPASANVPQECTPKQAMFQPRAWCPVTFTWTAPATMNKPLYFDEVQLENYGHSWGPYMQPIVSGVHFFAVIPMLPYAMGVSGPNECVYTLGYYRPGNCAPYMLDPFPWSLRGALCEAGFWTGAPFVF